MFTRKKPVEIEETDDEKELTVEEMLEKISKQLSELQVNTPRIKELEEEKNYWRNEHQKRVLFYERMLEKFLDKPVATPAKSIPEIIAEKKAALKSNSNSAGSANPTAGPVGKLP